MVKISDEHKTYYITLTNKEIERLIRRNKMLFVNCLQEMETLWTYTKYDIHTSAYNPQMMELLMNNLYKNFFYVKRNMKLIQKKFEKEEHLRRHQELKDNGEIDSWETDSDDF